MNRMVFVVVALLVIGACLPSNLIPISIAQPTVDLSGTSQASIPASFTPNATIQPTLTPLSVTETSVLPPVSSLPSETATTESSPIPNLTTTLATATEFAITPALATATLALPGPGTVTSTPHVLTYGTLPPAVPFSQITLSNRSKAQAYISLQVTTAEGGPTIIEYPVHGFVKVQAPIGNYLYVAWVGGNKMVGNFQLRKGEDLSIILYKDKVVIK